MVITAKYASKCATCQCRIEPGERIEWTKGSPTKHIRCPIGGAPVGQGRSAKPVPKGPKVEDCLIRVHLREEPCKRANLHSFLGEVRRLDDRTAEQHGCRYYVVQAEFATYFTADDSDDMGEGNGAYWAVELGGRPATEEEADELVAERAEAARVRALALLPAWIMRQIQSVAHYAPTLAVPQDAWRFSIGSWIGGSETLCVSEGYLWLVTWHYDDGLHTWRMPITSQQIADVAAMVASLNTCTRHADCRSDSELAAECKVRGHLQTKAAA